MERSKIISIWKRHNILRNPLKTIRINDIHRLQDARSIYKNQRDFSTLATNIPKWNKTIPLTMTLKNKVLRYKFNKRSTLFWRKFLSIQEIEKYPMFLDGNISQIDLHSLCKPSLNSQLVYLWKLKVYPKISKKMQGYPHAKEWWWTPISYHIQKSTQNRP